MITAVAIRSLERGYELALPAPNRHHHVIRQLAAQGHPLPIVGEQGFIDDQRGFVTREEAAQIALDEGQILKLEVPPKLYSEDLW